MTMKPAAIQNPRLALEERIRSNEMEAEQLLAKSRMLKDENDRIQAEMSKILSEPPPASRLVDAFTMSTAQMTGQSTPSSRPAESMRLSPEKEVIYAALAMVRSWNRRHKKNWKAQERELANAVERLTWEP